MKFNSAMQRIRRFLTSHDSHKGSIYPSPRFNKMKNYQIGDRNRDIIGSSLKMATFPKKRLSAVEIKWPSIRHAKRRILFC